MTGGGLSGLLVGDQRQVATAAASVCVTGFDVDGFSTCPQRRHSRRASILTMFMPHFGQGGRTSKQVKAQLLVGRNSFVLFRGQQKRGDRLETACTIAIPIQKCGVVDY